MPSVEPREMVKNMRHTSKMVRLGAGPGRGAGTQLMSWAVRAKKIGQDRSQKPVMNICVIEAIVRPCTERRRDSHFRQLEN